MTSRKSFRIFGDAGVGPAWSGAALPLANIGAIIGPSVDGNFCYILFDKILISQTKHQRK
jgi:hypothetical protein